MWQHRHELCMILREGRVNEKHRRKTECARNMTVMRQSRYKDYDSSPKSCCSTFVWSRNISEKKKWIQNSAGRQEEYKMKEWDSLEISNSFQPLLKKKQQSDRLNWEELTMDFA